MNIEIAALKVDLAAADHRIKELEEMLKQTREHLIKVRDAKPGFRNHETNQVIARAWHMLNFGGAGCRTTP